MKYSMFSLMLLSILLSSCTSGLRYDSEQTGKSNDCMLRAKFALAFINSDYKDMKNRTTDDFKRSLNDLEKKASKSPFGLNYDPIVAAQDTPPKGFSIDSCKGDGHVVLRGIGWKDFTVTVRVVNTKEGYKVDGSGVVNIPKEKQSIP